VRYRTNNLVMEEPEDMLFTEIAEPGAADTVGAVQ